MVAGQFPTRQWKDNSDGQIRTIEEAVEIAKKYGVTIPDDIDFHIDEANELNETFTACGPRVDKLAGERVHWSDLVHDRTHKVPFRLWAGLLKSDEAIVAVLSHEMHEILTLRPFLESGKIAIEDFISQTEPGRPENLHHEAWEIADKLVDKMRGESPP
jgi:hypothetical protein